MLRHWLNHVPFHCISAPYRRRDHLPGFTINQLNRCPGTNERNPGDNSTPFTDNHTLACNPHQVPPGP